MSKNHPKIYTKPPNGGYGNKHRDLALLETVTVILAERPNIHKVITKNLAPGESLVNN